MIEVVLEYKRTNVDKSTGRILVRTDIGHHKPMPLEVVNAEFVDSEFPSMLYKFAQALQDYPDAHAIIQRTDRPGLVPYNLDGPTSTLFRTDPVAAVLSMSTTYGSPSAKVAHVKKEALPPTPTLRVGFDTLADAFGDTVYSKYDEVRGRIECPCCGIWNSFFSEFVCVNPKCAQPLALDEKAGKWIGWSTSDLLATHSHRFYLPRAWNDYKTWVSWEALNEKYEQFKKEKASCP